MVSWEERQKAAGVRDKGRTERGTTLGPKTWFLCFLSSSDHTAGTEKKEKEKTCTPIDLGTLLPRPLHLSTVTSQR